MIRRVTLGITRTVFLVGRYAIKLPCARYGYRKWLQGLLANLQEREIARAQYPELCPVLFADPLGLVVVMPRAAPLTRDLTLAEYTALTEKDSYVLPVEWKQDSFGILNNRVVAVDYGT